LAITDDTKAIKMELAERYFGGKCFVCGKTKSRKGMTFHHKRYIVNDIVHSSYPKNTSGTLQYYKDLAPLIRQNPKRFLYLCSPHHQALERLLRYGNETLKNLLKAVKMSK
jgi:hypothetical protein